VVRVVKEPGTRRNEILDTAQRLIYTKGYEQMAIQDILNELQIAKGTFYHYFDSKQAMLEALIERMTEQALEVVSPIIHDQQLSALEKFRHFFDTSVRWKAQRKAFLIALLRVWYTDENVLVRQKVNAMAIQRMVPLLTIVIQQGVEEGILTTPFPEQAGKIVMELFLGLQDSLVHLLLQTEASHEILHRIETVVNVYSDALERVLGAPMGSLPLTDIHVFEEWMIDA
jgi:AcrR family transcriptional regulator